MKIHKKFVQQILLKRKAALRNLIIDEKSFNLSLLKPDASKLIDELDRIFYTLDFLEREKLIKIVKFATDGRTITLFDGFACAGEDLINSRLYYYEKFKNEAYGWDVEMQSGLIAFKNNNFRTDEQIKEGRNFWLAIFVGLGSALVTSVVTALLANFNFLKHNSVPQQIQSSNTTANYTPLMDGRY